ncbi:VOC family protein [Plantactinospora sp. WMMC1484]|uniref:VOC family protein n=1 Tax=Plantactinospora sp. WMMC1484 TaxID=3404122 RepID=UPI003BF4EA31
MRQWFMPLSSHHLRTSIAVSDIQQAVAFYEGKLGLPALRSGPSAEGIGARAGGGRIAWFQDPDGNTFALESDV